MGIIDSIKKMFIRKKPSELEKLNSVCNILFEKIFNTCRLELGSELLEIMKVKQSIIEKALGDDCYIPAKEIIAKNALGLVEVYLKLAENYVNFKNSTKNDSENVQIKEQLNKLKRKLDETFSLVKSLNVQLCANAVSNEITGEFEDVINEASALNNVLSESRNKDNF